ncbi:probable DNA double-strand break repair Rad50 ATPase isoform X1 [Chanodichthys erythropterus]|uniref:probable DNA double-strand break repair Rad50 ATPase isoform X1 n=1 Tax=Chanodichthys erythropterus TaxID=933992 RepID=UPI00351E9190
MAQRLQKRDETLSDEAKQPTDSIKRLRFILLGSDEVLINEACDTILRSTDDKKVETIKSGGKCEFREACVSGRHVSVVKTPTYWLENLKTYLFFSKSVRSMKSDMEFSYSMVFPGPHAFLLVLGDVRNSGKEHYLLRALSEVFGQEVLDYSMVLFMHGYSDRDIGRNRCVRKCSERYHILKDNEDNVLKLFQDATAMKQGKANFFTKDLELLYKAETYFKKEFDAKYEERENILRGDLAEMKTAEENLRTKMTEMEKQNSENVRELQDLREELDQLREELDAHRFRENQLRKDLDASISRENQLSQQIDALKEKKYELKEELFDLRDHKRQVNAELIASNERESQLKSDNEKLQRELEQLKDNEKKREKNPREEFLLTEKEEVQEEYDIPRTLDRREEELLQIVTGSEHGIHISTAVTPPSVSENKVKSLSGKECEVESRPTDSQNIIQDPPNNHFSILFLWLLLYFNIFHIYRGKEVSEEQFSGSLFA